MSKTPPLKQCLAERGPLLGCWLEMFSPIAAEVVAQAGYDCVLIDLEHGPGSYLDAVALMHAAQAAGKRLGAIPTPGRSVAELVAAGYDLIMADADVLLLRDAARASLAKLPAEI